MKEIFLDKNGGEFMSKKEYSFLEKALDIARKSNFNSIKIGACIVNKHQIIGMGCNNPKSNPIQKELNSFRKNDGQDWKHYVHAETAAILNAVSDLKGSTIYINRVHVHGSVMCKPCEACHHLLRRVGVKRVVYNTDNGVQEYRV